MNKTIYMTYKKEIPPHVPKRWLDLNPGYIIDFSLDADCIKFLRDNFNPYISWLFEQIPIGMYKADLWRLCKLYHHGGVYADVDLVPHLVIDDIISENPDVTWYSCLSGCNPGIFQAFIVSIKPKNPLLLLMIISFLRNNPFSYNIGPTFDMRNCLNEIFQNISPDRKLSSNEVKLKIEIGKSDILIKAIPLYYFPDDIKYNITLCPSQHGDIFNFKIANNTLLVRRIDTPTGWGYCHSCFINITTTTKECIYLFNEKIKENIVDCSIYYKNKKIMDSRDPEYYTNHGW
jgi:hypothetical protein